MFILLLLAYAGLPLIGIAMMDTGEFGPSIGQFGYDSRAAKAYAAYLLVLLVSAVLVIRRAPVVECHVGHGVTNKQFRRVAKWGVLINVTFIMIMLFGFGAINVWSGAVPKGEFRTSLGFFGSVAYILIKFASPILLATLAVTWRFVSPSRANKLLLSANFVLVYIFGTTWGFKALPITMIMPALIILYWRITVREFVLLFSTALGTVYSLFVIFDSENEGYSTVFEFLLRRVTTIQGDVSWLMWDQYTSGQVFPDYARTLLAGMGDKILSVVLQIDKSDYQTWVDYHYDLMLTTLAGSPIDQVEGGHSVTGTPFSEGLVAGGLVGVGVFAVLGGLFAGWNFNIVASAIRKGRALIAATGATYAVMVLFPWLNGGGIVQLFHISTFVGMGLAVAMVAGISRLRLSGAVRPGPTGPSSFGVHGIRSQRPS